MKRKPSPLLPAVRKPGYADLLGGVTALLEEARHVAARSVNAVLTATYWEVGRRIVEFEQKGKERAGYGEELLDRLSKDLSKRFGRGFGRRNLFQMRAFFLVYPRIVQTLPAQLTDASHEGRMQTASAKSPTLSARSSQASRGSGFSEPAQPFHLSWSHYVRLLSFDEPPKRDFYEEEARRAPRLPASLRFGQFQALVGEAHG